MKIFDISQEVFGCSVYEGDPAPERKIVSDMKSGALYNLTAFSMCAHNGTHVDAPSHFIKDGKTVSEMALESLVGDAVVVEVFGNIDGKKAVEIFEKAQNFDENGAKRLLLKGESTVSEAAAKVFLEKGILLIGTESQSVGDVSAPMAVHLILLEKEVALLEGLRLENVPEGKYFLFAAPINLGGADGAPVRSVLVEGL